MAKFVAACVSAVALVVSLAACAGGVSAEEVCQAMQKDKLNGGNNNDDMTKAEYTELRAQFAAVDDEALREHGLKLIDIGWQMSRIPEGKELGALVYMGSLTDAMTGVVGACAQHGVVLDLMEQ